MDYLKNYAVNAVVTKRRLWLEIGDG